MWAFVLLYADDWLHLLSGPLFRRHLGVFFLLLSVLRVPLSWAKTSGGHSLRWIGYEALLKELALGLTESRAAWLRGWFARLLEAGTVDLEDFRAGHGRAAFAFGALE